MNLHPFRTPISDSDSNLRGIVRSPATHAHTSRRSPFKRRQQNYAYVHIAAKYHVHSFLNDKEQPLPQMCSF